MQDLANNILNIQMRNHALERLSTNLIGPFAVRLYSKGRHWGKCLIVAIAICNGLWRAIHSELCVADPHGPALPFTRYRGLHDRLLRSYLITSGFRMQSTSPLPLSRSLAWAIDAVIDALICVSPRLAHRRGRPTSRTQFT